MKNNIDLVVINELNKEFFRWLGAIKDNIYDKEYASYLLLKKADSIMNKIKKLSNNTYHEQIDKITGVGKSAIHLTWNYAAIITALL